MSVHENGSKERPMANPKPQNLRPDGIDHKRSYTHERTEPDTEPPQGGRLHEGSMQIGGEYVDVTLPKTKHLRTWEELSNGDQWEYAQEYTRGSAANAYSTAIELAMKENPPCTEA
jgi:hypothetical protein